MKIFSPLLIVGFSLLPLWAQGRDPFWPIGYTGGVRETVPVVEPQVQAPKVGRELSDDELRELARKESERIRQSLERKGTMIAGNKIYAYVGEKWVTTGDMLSVQVEGNLYRLEILSLTSDNIELEAHRAASPLHNQPRK
ncbi:MAG: hypothetical protein ACO3N7_00325 [Kiritimatiellia bacterium]